MTDDINGKAVDEQDLLRKINLLLRKAESTDSEHEADAFFAKAHELMVRHAIDDQRIRLARKAALGGKIEEPVVEDWMFATYAHHAQAKTDLLNVVCQHHYVKAIPYENRKNSNDERVAAAGLTGLYESQWVKLVGYKDDIEHCKMLFLSLLLQSTKFANDDWRDRYGNQKHSSWDDGHMGKFAWMSAHMEGFAERIGSRFKELTEAIYAEVPDGSALITDKMTNILEWMYEHGLARRPAPVVYHCWTAEPEENRPFNADGRTRSKRWEPLCCIKVLPAQGVPHEGEHAFTYRPPKLRYSYYGGSGRQTSREGRDAGRSAANRADIGLSRVGNTARIKG